MILFCLLKYKVIIANLLNRVRFVVVPIVNPDGYNVSSGNIFLQKYYIFGNSNLGPLIVCGERTEGV